MIENRLKVKYVKLKSITKKIVNYSYDFEVENSHRIIAKHPQSKHAFYTSNCDHPEIFEYIDAKREEGVLTNFNISVGITNHFIKCVLEDLDFDLVFKGKVYKTIKARELWDKICYSGWMYNDPGIINLDELQYWNPLFYKEVLDSVNP